MRCQSVCKARGQGEVTPEELNDWLDARPEATRVQEATWIASRAAARVLPVVLRHHGNDDRIELDERIEWLELQSCRCLLISGVSVLCPTPEVRVAAVHVCRTSVKSAISDGPNVHQAAVQSVFAVAAEATFSASEFSIIDAADGVAAAARALAIATNAADTIVTTDADIAFLNGGGQVVEPRPLWPGPVPDEIAKMWEIAQTRLTQDHTADWCFWIDWYNALLEGRPQDLKMLTEIALILDADWKQGPAHVNAMIADIAARHSIDDLIARNPYAHHVQVSGKHLIAIPVETPDLDHIIDAIRQSLRDFTARCRRDNSPNNLGQVINAAFGESISDLRRDLGRYKTDPLTLFDKLAQGQREMQRIAEREGFPPDGPAARLTDALETHRDDICIAAPAVLETERNRLAVRVARYTDEQRMIAVRLCAGMLSDSDGVLKAASALAIRTILNPDSTEGEQKNAWYFLKAVIPRGAKAMRAAGIREASPEKAKSALEKLAGGADKLVKIDKGVDAMQEMGTEGVGWVTEIWTQATSGNLWGLFK